MNKHKILIVEDEAHIAEVLIAYCQNNGYLVEHLSSGKEVIPFIEENSVDLILLDLMLPDIDGLEICKKIRTFSQLPIIMITAKGEEIDKLLGLEFGADDYICKPFSPREVMARVKTVLRRVTNNNTELDAANSIKHSEFEMKINEFEVTFKGQFLDLTPREFLILRLFLENSGRVFSRDEILVYAYSDTLDISDRNIDTHIKNIRKKINQIAEEAEPIRSVYGIGYKFNKL
ncbi:response regulator [Psychromonas sp. SR45-3]|uniref:response regulator n=1 Tax=Psychromonas sp. SR45-3 TaxID=2760930 RepID=UPI0015FAD419|nr:response regulator [Psychromonas sp. SR45-3]MBB1271280.1 response regulator [Psychromonas sp. SR45-3]